jgi:formylglycine-generating enzyme required for sulfatase activity
MRFLVASLLLCLGTALVHGQNAGGKSSPQPKNPPTPGKQSTQDFSPQTKTKSSATTVRQPVTSLDFSGSRLGTGSVFKYIRPGSFHMGSPSGEGGHADETLHRVTLTQEFWILDHEVTQKEYKAIMMGANPSRFSGDQLPVERVSYQDAVTFCLRLTHFERQNNPAFDQRYGYRLPTEAEWEYAARAGSISPRYGDLDSIAWWYGNSSEKTHEVRSKNPNGFKLYDMLGNVWEWCSDWYGPYDPKDQTNPTGPSSGSSRVCRGGAWNSLDMSIRSAKRTGTVPTDMAPGIGFRPVLVLNPKY